MNIDAIGGIDADEAVLVITPNELEITLEALDHRKEAFDADTVQHQVLGMIQGKIRQAISRYKIQLAIHYPELSAIRIESEKRNRARGE